MTLGGKKKKKKEITSTLTQKVATCMPGGIKLQSLGSRPFPIAYGLENNKEENSITPNNSKI